MSQQGGRPTGHEDDWWRQLYDDSTEDTGPAAAADSLDDRFASAAGTLDSGPSRTGPRDEHPPEPDPEPDPGPAPSPGPETGPGPRPGPAPESGATPGPSPRPPETATGPAGRPADRPSDGLAGRPGDGLPGRPAHGPVGGPVGGPVDRHPNTAAEGWQRAPWEPPAAVPAGPTTFPPGPRGPEPAAAPDSDPAFAPDLEAEPRPQPHPEPPAPADSAPGGYAPPLLVTHVGSGPPTYDAEPTALPAADPDGLDELVPDTVLDGARYGACTLRAVSVRGDSPRYRGEPRRDALLTARFGAGEQALVLVAMATGARARPDAHRAAAEVCRWIARAVGRSHVRLAEDIRAARRGELKSGLHRLTDRSLGRLRAGAAELGVPPEEYAATLRCLLLPADPACRTRVFFGVGAGGLFRLREGTWQDIEPRAADGPAADPRAVSQSSHSSHPSPLSGPAETPEGDRLTLDLGLPAPPAAYAVDPGAGPVSGPPPEPFRFRACLTRPGDTLLMCTAGLAEPLRGEEELGAHLARRWSDPAPPGLAAFLADAQVRVKGYADDRTAAAVWEA
ncbi:protein phosphatase 2C domain-containing protein [Streptomyces sp. NPDC021356]|uniref:protein phosphatase 2C domain-containing protein n=1 Tax=Streptomyces sp. NPDC021356 TaxID=3154900 RepID=UPI0033E4BECA